MAWSEFAADRALNLIHRYALEQIALYPGEEAMNGWHEQTQRLSGAAGTLRTAPATSTPRIGPEPPSWWISDEDATASNFAAMAMMGGVPT